MNIKNSLLDHIRYKQLDWYGHVPRMIMEDNLETFWIGVHLKEENKELKIRGYRK